MGGEGAEPGGYPARVCAASPEGDTHGTMHGLLHYQVLGVSKDADADAIKRAYKKLALK